MIRLRPPSPPSSKRSELPWRAIVPMALAVFVLAFALFLTELVRNTDGLRRNLADRQHADLEFIEQSISDALVVGDFAAVQQLLRAAIRDRSIRYVALTTRNDAKILRRRRRARGDDRTALAGSLRAPAARA